jgi:Flp pilus assembly protein TadD
MQAGVDWLWESTATVALALLLVAAAAASRSRPALPPRAVTRVVVCAIALLAVAVQLPPLAGVSALRASQAAAREHDDHRARAAAGDAAAILPWAASPHVQLALLAESRGDLAVAEREARDAIALEPTNWSHPLLLARVLAERGDAPAALAAFVRARELRPKAAVFRTAGF